LATTILIVLVSLNTRKGNDDCHIDGKERDTPLFSTKEYKRKRENRGVSLFYLNLYLYGKFSE
jgi:hypothetical protein